MLENYLLENKLEWNLVYEDDAYFVCKIS